MRAFHRKVGLKRAEVECTIESVRPKVEVEWSEHGFCKTSEKSW